MMRILFIEDQERSREQAVKLISECLPNSAIDAVGTISEGLMQLKEAFKAKKFYDVAIVDFGLPKEIGHVPLISTKIPEEILLHHESTLIVYVTAYADDPKVDKHLRQYHAETGHPASVISKLGTTDGSLVEQSFDDLWTNRLIYKLKSHFYQKKIEKRMSRIFREYSYSNARFRAGRANGISVTYELAALIQDITQYWTYLDEAFRNVLRNKFDIAEKEKLVQVRLR